MGILDRVGTIIKSNINDLLDKAEDPAKLCDQYILDLTDALADVKAKTAAVMAEEKRCKRALDEGNAEVARMEGLAKKAIAAGNDGDARTFLAKKQELAATASELESAYRVAKKNADDMRAAHDRLVSELEEMKRKRQTIKAKVSVAKTKNMVAGYADSGSKKADGAKAAFDRMSEKADRMLDEADAMGELSEEPVDEASKLEAKYAGMDSDAAVEDELARLKAEMGVGVDALPK